MLIFFFMARGLKERRNQNGCRCDTPTNSSEMLSLHLPSVQFILCVCVTVYSATGAVRFVQYCRNSPAMPPSHDTHNTVRS